MHAPRAGGEIRVEDMTQSYWAKRYNGARRIVDAGNRESGDGRQETGNGNRRN
jgi:hypothetical protein